jgi:rhodanese-related sulfurtransferase
VTVPAADAPTIDEHLRAVRSTYRRVEAAEAFAAVAEGAVLVDIRPVAQRIEEGEIPGALVVERNVLEWRFAPTSSHRLPQAPPADDPRPVIIVCSEGYASSLAAASLRQLGVLGATDLVGGIAAWASAGLPVEHRRTRALGLPAV